MYTYKQIEEKRKKIIWKNDNFLDNNYYTEIFIHFNRGQNEKKFFQKTHLFNDNKRAHAIDDCANSKRFPLKFLPFKFT